MPNLNFQRLRLEAQALVEKNSKNPEKDEQLGNDVARILLENLKQGDKEADIKKQLDAYMHLNEGTLACAIQSLLEKHDFITEQSQVRPTSEIAEAKERVEFLLDILMTKTKTLERTMQIEKATASLNEEAIEFINKQPVFTVGNMNLANDVVTNLLRNFNQPGSTQETIKKEVNDLRTVNSTELLGCVIKVIADKQTKLAKLMEDTSPQNALAPHIQTGTPDQEKAMKNLDFLSGLFREKIIALGETQKPQNPTQQSLTSDSFFKNIVNAVMFVVKNTIETIGNFFSKKTPPSQEHAQLDQEKSAQGKSVEEGKPLPLHTIEVPHQKTPSPQATEKTDAASAKETQKNADEEHPHL